MPSPNELLARRWLHEVWNERRTETVHELMAADAVGHTETEAGIRDVRGPEQFLGFRNALLTAVPDLRVEVEDAIAQGENVVVRWFVRGTVTAGGAVSPPGRQDVGFRGMTWMVMRDGKVVEGWDCWNFGGAMSQLRTPLPSV